MKHNPLNVVIVSVFCFLLLPDSVRAENSAQDSAAPAKDTLWYHDFREPSVALYSNIWSKYLNSQGIVLSDEPVIQTGLWVGFENGIWLDFWHSTGLESGFNTGFDDEIDLTIGWTGEIGEDLKVEIGFSYFKLYPLDKWGGIDLLRPYAEISRLFSLDDDERHKITPYLKGELYWTMNGSEKAKPVISGGLRHKWEISENWSFSHQLALLHDSGMFGFNSGLVGNYEAGINWSVTNQITVRPIAVKVTVPLTTSDSRKTEAVIGAGLSINF